MKVKETTFVVQPPRTFAIELSEREAMALLMIVNKAAGEMGRRFYVELRPLFSSNTTVATLGLAHDLRYSDRDIVEEVTF